MSSSPSLPLIFFVVSLCDALPTKGQWDPHFGVPGASGSIHAFHKSGTLIIAAGAFLSINNGLATNIAQWDGTNWSPIGRGIGFQTNNDIRNDVRALQTFRGDLYVGGIFNFAGDVRATNIAKWNGTNWSAVGNGLNAEVFALATDGRDLFAGGHFTQSGSQVLNHTAKWNGTNWLPLGSGMGWDGFPSQSAFVTALGFVGNTLYAGGHFRLAGGNVATNIAKWDGTNWSSLGQRDPGAIYAFATKDNDLYVGGSFSKAGTVPARSIARWDGRQWFDVGGSVTAFSSLPYVVALAFNGNDLFVAGLAFTEVGGVRATNIAKWDGTRWSGLGFTDPDGVSQVLAIAVTGSELYVGGGFSTAGGVPSTNIALWHIPHALRAAKSGTNVTLSWPATGSNFALESTQSLAGSNWNQVPKTPLLEGDSLAVTNPITSGNEFFRLRRK